MTIPRRLLARSLGSQIRRDGQAAVREMDYVFVENLLMLEWTKEQGQEAVALVPPGIDTTLFAPCRAWNSRPLWRSGVSARRKGLVQLLLAYNKLAAQWPGAPDLVLAGEGRFAGDQGVLDASPLDHGSTCDTDLSQADVISLLQKASVFAQASFEEGLGLAGLEAMAYGLPMVATDTAGTRQYLRSRSQRGARCTE